jgi:AAHS family 4-hydroxybenzoate transporter-like MFS transporter
MSTYQWLLVILCFLVVTIDGMDVAVMGFVAPSILHDFNVSRPAFGFVMGAAPIGLAIGALFGGPVSDLFGRRKVLLVSVLGFGLLTIVTAYCATTTEMALARLIKGIWLGAAMPNTTTLLSEYVPKKSRSFLITVMFTGFNLGSGSIGFVAAYMIPLYGWQSVLVFGGVLPLIMFPFLYAFLPESACYMVARNIAVDKIRAVMTRVCRTNLDHWDGFVLNEETKSKVPVAVIFSSGYTLRTLTLWVTYFMGLLVIYLTTSWLPVMMKDAGQTIERAASVTAMFQIAGTVGAVLVGLAMDRWNPNRIIAASYFLGGIFLIMLGVGGLLSPWVVVLVAAVGFCLSGAQTGLNAFAPGCYPTVARSTGVSWMMSAGRLGSILGSSIGGVLLSLGWGFEGIFSALAVPAVLAATAIMINRLSLKGGLV